MSFKAVLLNKDQQGFSARVTELEDEDLPAGNEVLISVEYSTLNYKDALALTVTRLWYVNGPWCPESMAPAWCWKATTRAFYPVSASYSMAGAPASATGAVWPSVHEYQPTG